MFLQRVVVKLMKWNSTQFVGSNEVSSLISSSSAKVLVNVNAVLRFYNVADSFVQDFKLLPHMQGGRKRRQSEA